MRQGTCINCAAQGRLTRRGSRLCESCNRALALRRLNLALARKKTGESLPRGQPCACCGQAMEQPCLDHCHKTDRDRAWLCIGCNVAIGQAGDSVTACMDRAIAALLAAGKARKSAVALLGKAERWTMRAAYLYGQHHHSSAGVS